MSENKIFIKLFLIFLIFSYFQSFSQSDSSQVQSLKKIFDKIKTSYSDDSIFYYANSADSLCVHIFSSENAFEYNFDILKNYLSFLTSDDEKLKIITWNIATDNLNNYKYFGYILYRPKKNGQTYFFKLTDKSDEIKNPQRANISAKKWFGCIYYQLITNKAGSTTYYTLLGWDGNSLISNKKIIEVLTFKKDKPVFGYDFDIEGEKYKRIIFEYNKQAEMTLHYDPNAKMIVWDHLSPSEPKYKDIYQFYGPDFTYDGLKFKQKKWYFYSNIDIKNPKPKDSNK